MINKFIIYINKWLPIWFCNVMEWHIKPINNDGICPRCRRIVILSANGNWFASDNEDY